MEKRWFKIKHGLGVSPMVRSMGSAVWGGDYNAALGCWVRWLDYVETHSPKTGRVAVGSLAGFGELVIGVGSKKSVCEKIAGWLMQYRDEQGEPVLTFDEETGIVQMLRWEERFKAEKPVSTPRTQKHRERKKLEKLASSDPPSGTLGNTNLSLSLSSASSPESEEEPEFLQDLRYPLPESLFDLVREDKRASAADEIGLAWGSWCAARVEAWGDLPSASIAVLRREIAEQLSQRGPEFVAWCINRAAGGAYKTIHWDAKAWKAGESVKQRKPGEKRRGGRVR